MKAVQEFDIDLNQVAEIQLKYSPQVKASNRPQLGNASDVFELLFKSWNKDLIALQEEFKMILLNRANRVLGIVTISKGSSTGTVVDPKMLFSITLKSTATSIILTHNHPSGNLKPSRSDIELTKKLVAASKLLEISILDHIIICDDENRYFSFADEGLL